MARRLLVTSVLAGLLLGVAARVVMRFVALESGLDPGFSAGGSLEVIAFAALVGAPLAGIFLATRRRIAVPLPWAGLVYGAAVFSVLVAWPPAAARSALEGTTDTPAATTAAFGLLFIAWGVALELLATSAPMGRRR